LMNKYGAQAKTVLLTEPYRVAREIDGIGFKTADRIAINLGFANDAPPRLDAGILYALEVLQEEGHTAIREDDLGTHAATLLETSIERIQLRLDALVEGHHLVRHRPAGVENPLPGSAMMQLPVLDRAERRIAHVVHRLGAVPSGLPPIKVDAAVAWAEQKASITFAEKQRAALRQALQHKCSILT